MAKTLVDFLNELKKREECVIKGFSGEDLIEITGKEIFKEAEKLACFLKEQSVCYGDRVAVIAEKCPETVYAFFGIWLCGGVAVPVCETLQNSEMEYILKDSGSKVIVSDSSLKEKIAGLGCVLQGKVFSFEDCLKNNEQSTGRKKSLPGLSPKDTAFLIYTSGSTGHPKGVVLSHSSIYTNASVSADYICMNSGDSVMSILPLWHSFALTAELFTMLHVGGRIYIPRSKSTFLRDVKTFQPTIILSIPRLAEMLKKGIEGSVQKKSTLQKKIFKWAQKVSLDFHLTPEEKRGAFLKSKYRFVQKVVFTKVKESFGGNIRYFIGGGAPLDRALQSFFFSIDIPMYQGYGLTEASPVISINAPHSFKEGTSGCILPWMTEPEYQGDFCFEDETGKQAKDIRGELLVKGPCVMKGYWHDEQETRDTLKNGWLYTGDVGYLDSQGFLVLDGRKKNLLCLQGGEKFYPEFVEERLMQSPYISQAMVIGEGRKRCSVLLNVNDEKSSGKLQSEISKVLSKEIARLTSELEAYQKPAGHLVLPSFSSEDGLLTNTMKIRRHKVFEKYGKKIEDFLERN